MDNLLITILTPAYNRGNYLPKLYQSLKRQESKNFCWMIVDDGSTDDTMPVVEEMLPEKDFAIIYYKKVNGGKHTALNYGLKKVCTPLCFIVDSDDWLADHAISAIESRYLEWKTSGEDHLICGFSFLRMYPDGKVNGKEFTEDGFKASYITSRINAHDTSHSDKAEVFFTKCLKEFPFPEFEGEHFLGEDLVWIRMGRKYEMLHYNEPIYVSDYLVDGLTNNRRKHNMTSPKGCKARALEFMHKDIILSMRIKGTLQYLIYGHTGGEAWSRLIGKSPQKLLTVICFLPSVFLYHKWRRRYLCGR